MTPSEFKKVDGVPELEPQEDIFGTRLFPYIAVNNKLSKHIHLNLLWWGKDWREVIHNYQFDMPSDNIYSVYQIRIKPEYLKNLAEELEGYDAFFVEAVT